MGQIYYVLGTEYLLPSHLQLLAKPLTISNGEASWLVAQEYHSPLQLLFDLRKFCFSRIVMFTSPEKVHVASAWLSFSVFQGVSRDGESRTTVLMQQVKTYKVLHMDKKVHMILQIEES